MRLHRVELLCIVMAHKNLYNFIGGMNKQTESFIMLSSSKSPSIKIKKARRPMFLMLRDAIVTKLYIVDAMGCCRCCTVGFEVSVANMDRGCYEDAEWMPAGSCLRTMSGC